MNVERIFEDYLEDILEYAEKAHRFLEETPTVDDLQKDERTLLAVVRALEVIGDAAKRIPRIFGIDTRLLTVSIRYFTCRLLPGFQPQPRLLQRAGRPWRAIRPRPRALLEYPPAPPVVPAGG